MSDMEFQEMIQYEQMIFKKTYKELQDEKIALGKQISDSAMRIQELSSSKSSFIDKEVDLLKEFKS